MSALLLTVRASGFATPLMVTFVCPVAVSLNTTCLGSVYPDGLPSSVQLVVVVMSQMPFVRPFQIRATEVQLNLIVLPLVVRKPAPPSTMPRVTGGGEPPLQLSNG